MVGILQHCGADLHEHLGLGVVGGFGGEVGVADDAFRGHRVHQGVLQVVLVGRERGLLNGAWAYGLKVREKLEKIWRDERSEAHRNAAPASRNGR